MDLKKKIKGASILESLIAMTIILLSVTLTGIVYSGISGQQSGLKTVFFQQRCQQIFNAIEATEGEAGSAVQTHDGYLYEVKSGNYMSRRDIFLIKIEVKKTDNNRKVFEFNRLIQKTDAIQTKDIES